MIQSQTFKYDSVSCFTQRPSANIRYLIQRQLPKLIDIAIGEALEFVNTNETKSKSLKQLKYTLLIGQANIKQHLQKIIKSLVKIWQLQIENVEKTIAEIMNIIGFYVKSDYYLPLMMSILREDQIKNSNKNTIILLKLIAHMLLTSQDIELHLDQIHKLITTYQSLLLQNDEGLSTVSQIAITVVNRLPSIDKQHLVSAIFSVFLNVEATPSISAQFIAKTKKSMQLLAKKAGFGSVPQLHSKQIGPVLDQIISKKQYVNWTKTNKNRFRFDTIVRNCEGEAIRYLNQILTVMQFCISLECDIQIRMDTLVLLQQMLTNQKIRYSLKQYASRVYLKILNVAIKWKVGKAQIKIRKAGVIDMIKMIELGIINEVQLLQCLSQILPQIKSCISDDWGPELRLCCCQFLQCFLSSTKQIIDPDHLRDIYVILLQRLDDSQDPIRQKASTAINHFFMAKCLKISPSISSTIQYMITAIFIHFDDNNEQIRDSINTNLRHAARIDPTQVLKNAKANLSKMKHKTQCQELIQFCSDVIEQRKS